jgi:hypothetical protein
LSGSPLTGRSFYLEGSGRPAEALTASYDEDADVLYLWRGPEPVEAISLPMDSGPIVRVDPRTREVVGVTLMDFDACWSDCARIELDVPQLGASEPEAAEMYASEHRRLVLA